MTALTLLIFTIVIAVSIAYRTYIKRAMFALLWAYANHWNHWIGKVEKEHDLMLKRNVLTRRE